MEEGEGRPGGGKLTLAVSWFCLVVSDPFFNGKPL
jgi:hypothetical protein